LIVHDIVWLYELTYVQWWAEW